MHHRPHPAHAGRARSEVDPVGQGYAPVKDFVANARLKDLALEQGRPVRTMMGEGVIDWPGQLRRLRDDGCDGPLTLGPDLRYQPGRDLDLVEQVERFLSHVRRMLADLQMG